MFFAHCHGFGCLGTHSLVDSMQLLAAFSVEHELQASREREQLEQSEKSEREKKDAPAPRPY